MALHAPDWDVCLLVSMGAGSWIVGIREQTWGEDCCWLWEYGLRDREGGNLQQGMPMQENQTAMGAGHYC